MADNGYQKAKQMLREFLESHYAEDENGRKVNSTCHVYLYAALDLRIQGTSCADSRARASRFVC